MSASNTGAEALGRLLKRTYPVGIPDRDFFPLARLLADAGYGRRSIADAIALAQGGDYLDYIYEVGPLLDGLTITERDLKTVQEKLQVYGFQTERSGGTGRGGHGQAPTA